MIAVAIVVVAAVAVVGIVAKLVNTVADADVDDGGCCVGAHDCGAGGAC